MSYPSGLDAIVSDAGGERILVAQTPLGISLPFASLEPGDWSHVDGREIKGAARAAAAVEHETSVRVTMLYGTEWPKGDEAVRRVLRLHAFECMDANADAVAPYVWVDRSQTTASEWVRPYMADAVAALVALSDGCHRPVPWWVPGWAAETTAWLDERLAVAGVRRVGRLEQVKNGWQSIVMRAPTGDGDVYLKALAPPGSRELAVLRDVLAPGPNVPTLLGLDAARGLVLMRDVGGVNPSESARGSLTAEDLRALTEGYARVQRSTANVAPGAVFDCRLERMPALLSAVIDDLSSLLPDDALAELDAARVRELVPAVARVCDAALRVDIPPHLVHADLDGNTVVTANGPVFYDWAAAYVSHPFLDVYEFEDSLRAATDVDGAEAAIGHYLNAWTDYAPIRELRQVVTALSAIRSVPGLIKGAHCLRHLPSAESELRTMPYAPLSQSAAAWQRSLVREIRRLPGDLAHVA
ncbi:hypothetical protein HN371_09635 [Candidatus Poribacteria bacterium]|nr:hypothetical protein [Candidatus Poribacteria bacterium]MBT5536522.1 hypothetical protein [Candidatus Poribacteria bacterium]MBT5713818.1 hypothetical protein [Candidatus Poribacteria bacterium]MBT7809676.1 hypothetical protein [Candidatus Poribacteria bacterium]